MKYRWEAVVVILTLLFMCGCGRKPAQTGNGEDVPRIPEDKKLIVCTSHKKEVYEPIIREFEERTGIWVEVYQGGTKAMLEKIKAGYEFGEYDIMFGGGVVTLDSYKACFEPYEVADCDRLMPQLKSEDNAWTPFTELPIVFIYNTKTVSEEDAPDSWADLFDEKWKGKISFADPFESGTSYTILSGLVQMFAAGDSDEAAGEVLRKFYDQLDGEQAAGSSMVLTEVAGGSKSIGIALEEAALRRISEGEHIGIVYPSDRIIAVPDGCAIVKNAPNADNARLFADFIVSGDVQKFMSEELFRRTVRSDIENPDYFREIEIGVFDILKSAREEERILDMWREYEAD
ncbi:MAG: extracellular solute-binding protein [Lachnospiraceae bacterium]|nr:extracellular solute-binding protein [Lachnospiraceae bacterium]